MGSTSSVHLSPRWPPRPEHRLRSDAAYADYREPQRVDDLSITSFEGDLPESRCS